MISIKRFNESKKYDNLHNIPEEDILDVCLELTDMGFDINIDKSFINSDNKRSDEPLSTQSFPIYDITFSKEDEPENRLGFYNGSYYYDEISTLKAFTSTLNKMKMLNIKDARYTISNMRYSIRLLLNSVEIEETGFDFYHFKEDLYKYLQSMENESDFFNRNRNRVIELKEFSGGGSSLAFEVFTNGKYNDSKEIYKAWETKDDINNQDQYNDIITKINKYLSKYSKHIISHSRFEQFECPHSELVKVGLFKKKKKTYTKYSFAVSVKDKDSD